MRTGVVGADEKAGPARANAQAGANGPCRGAAPQACRRRDDGRRLLPSVLGQKRAENLRC